MGVRSVRAYADTSIFGGVFDDEFAEPSRAFFDQVRNGVYRLVLSAVVRDELDGAPACVRELLAEIGDVSETVDVSDEAVLLQQAYLDAGIVGPSWATDALHVAVATVSDCRLIVSWNFKHIVHFQKIPLYNGVNMAHGYAAIAIHSPQEVIVDADEGKDL